MTRSHCLITTAFVLLAPPTARAQAPAEPLSSLQIAVACAPPPATTMPGSASLHVIGTQDTMARTLFSERDLLVLDGGTATGVQLAQQYFVRRPVATNAYTGGSSRHAVRTAAWVRVIAANETTAIASVDHACGFIEAGDYLEPFAVPAVPDQADRVDRSGELDFKALGRVLFGEDERVTASAGDFMLIDLGTGHATGPGARFAIYRDVQMWMNGAPGAGSAPLPLASIGEGVVGAASPTMSVLRILEARGAVQRGDVVVPRKP